MPCHMHYITYRIQCVCIYIYIYTHTYAYTHTYVYTYIYIYIFIDLFVLRRAVRGIARIGYSSKGGAVGGGCSGWGQYYVIKQPII